MIRKGVCLLLAAIACSACSDEVDLGREYALVSVGGDPLPSEIQVSGMFVEAWLDEGVLTFEDGVATSWFRFRFIEADGDTIIGTEERSNAYRREGSRVILEVSGEPGPGMCFGAPNYRLVADGDELITDGSTNIGDCDDSGPGFETPEYRYRIVE